MAWVWHTSSSQSLNDAQIDSAIERLKETADIHKYNFRRTTGPRPERDREAIKQSVVDGYMVLAAQTVSASAVDQTFFFQRSEWLTGQLNEPVWVVSYGFDQSLLPDNSNPADSRTFIETRMTPILLHFMGNLGLSLDYLFSIDHGRADLQADPRGSKIGRLQHDEAGAVDAEWRIVQQTSYEGETLYHYYWGATDGRFVLTKIEAI